MATDYREQIAASEYVNKMLSKPDGHNSNGTPYWFAKSLGDAFLAGLEYYKAKRAE